MKLSRKSIALAALMTTALGTAVAVVPSYAQDNTAPATTATTDVAMAGPRVGGPGPGPGDMFAMVVQAEALLEQFDTNGDGAISQDEIDAVRAGELAEYDTNGDGTLSLEEYQAYWMARFYERMVDAFQRLDANGDGEITAEEFNAGLANIVARLDRNGDGVLNADDREAVQMRIEAHRAEGAGQFGPGGPGQFGPGQPGPGQFGPGNR